MEKGLIVNVNLEIIDLPTVKIFTVGQILKDYSLLPAATVFNSSCS